MKKSLLIVSYTFPPYDGIGGRRWAKFAKYLKRLNYTVKIISAKVSHLKESEWVTDIADLKDDIYYIPSNYPKWLGINPKTLTEKLFYHLSLKYVKLFSKGNFYDKSIFWKKKLLKAADEIIKRFDIQNLICTVAPFHSSFNLLELKKMYPQINYIVDYRDPWTNNQTAYGFTSLSSKRFNYELLMERSVLWGADYVSAVSSEMFNYFEQICPGISKDKFIYLPNGFDEEDFIDIPSKSFFSSENKNSINLVFAGTLYQKAIPVFKIFIDTLEEINKQSEFRISLFMAGIIPDEVKNKNNLPFVHFLPFLQLKDTYALIKNADYALLFLTDDLNYSRSTKFYEYIGLRKKIWVISRYHGHTSEFVENNGIGMGLCEKNMKEKILICLTRFSKKGKTEFYDSGLYEQFSLTEITKTLIPYLK